MSGYLIDKQPYTFCCWGRNMLELGQYHGCWWPGSLLSQVIRSHDIDWNMRLFLVQATSSAHYYCKIMFENDKYIVHLLWLLLWKQIIYALIGVSWHTTATVAEEANKVTFALHKCLNDLRNINPHEMMPLFDRYISPILNYGCEVWGFHKAPNIERMHLNFWKRILRLNKLPRLILFTVSLDDTLCLFVGKLE